MELLEIDIALPRRGFELRAALTVGSETIALIGPSGAGKTSLLRAIAGLERPRAGRVAHGDQTWFDADKRIDLRPEQRRVGYLPQDYGLFPHLDVAANVRFAGKRDRPDLLSRFGVAHLARARPGQLSGGERQRVALARALAREPHVLLLDEPFAALDAITRQRLRDELADELASLALPTLLVTHGFDDAVALAPKIGVLDAGRLVQLGSPTDLIATPASGLVAALTGANVLDATAIPTPSGSRIQLHGGGELASAARATGQVQVVLQPWELTLADPGTSKLTDTVVSVREDHGRRVLRLTRFTVHMTSHKSGTNGATPTPGEQVGLEAAPADVRLILS